jgi:hypothetical protein
MIMAVIGTLHGLYAVHGLAVVQYRAGCRVHGMASTVHTWCWHGTVCMACTRCQVSTHKPVTGEVQRAMLLKSAVATTAPTAVSMQTVFLVSAMQRSVQHSVQQLQAVKCGTGVQLLVRESITMD